MIKEILLTGIFLCGLCSMTWGTNQNPTSYKMSTLSTNNVKSTSSETNYLLHWTVGKQVSFNSVTTFGLDRCFKIESISDATFNRMKGKTWKKDCPLNRNDFRYIKVLHYTADNKIKIGELVCNKAIATDIVKIFRQLFDKRYPIEKMVLIDNYDADDERSMTDNNTSCFNFRHIAGTKHLSKHSLGMAIDINPLYNPCVRTIKGKQKITPNAGKTYANRMKQNIPYKIDHQDLCYKLFIAHGFKWGGNWKSLKDYQHFEK